jgi:hypothetical protein
MHENSGGGLFNKEWLSLQSLGIFEGTPILSSSLQLIFKNRSINTGGFLTAALLSEGLIEPSKGKAHRYQGCDPTVFTTAIQALITLEAKQNTASKKKVAA